MAVLGYLFWFIAGSLIAPHIIGAYTPPTIHHTLDVELDPETHHLTATDVVQLPKSLFHQAPLSFALNAHLTIDRVAINGQFVTVSKVTENPLVYPTFTQWMIEYSSSNLKQSESLPIITIVYHGHIDESPTASSSLRFVRPDKTNGHIGPEGIYLTSETFWYPTWEQHLVTFDLALRLPSDWQAITQGQETNQSVRGGQ